MASEDVLELTLTVFLDVESLIFNYPAAPPALIGDLRYVLLGQIEVCQPNEPSYFSVVAGFFTLQDVQPVRLVGQISSCR